MKFKQFLEDKENINNNYLKLFYSKKEKLPINYLAENVVQKKKEINLKSNNQRNKYLIDSLKELEKNSEIAHYSNYFNNYNNINTEEDLDIELSSISKKIPINNFINLEQISNTQPDKIRTQARSKIKRIPSTNSFFEDIPSDNYHFTKNNKYNDNFHQCSEFNLTNFGLKNWPNIDKENRNQKEEKNENYYNNITKNNINNKISLFNNEIDFPIKRHNSVIIQDINKFLDTNNETNFFDNNIYLNNQYLYENIQKLKKENKRLYLKNNELSLKLKAQGMKTKINSNYNSINQKKETSQKEEFLLQKIKKLENQIIKQKDIILKITYNKRFNIGIRKIRVNSIFIHGNNIKLKRKNSFNLNNLDCFKINKKKIISNKTNFNKTLPNNFSKNIRRKSQNTRTNKVDSLMHIKPFYSSISSSLKRINKMNKNTPSININKMNTTMSVYNKNNSIKLKLDNFEATQKFRKNLKIKESKINNFNFKFNECKNEDIRINVKKQKNNYNNNKYKKLVPHKAYGKTSLIMSVINDTGNFNLSSYMVDHNNKTNKELRKN